jgi:hypothetical protein
MCNIYWRVKDGIIFLNFIDTILVGYLMVLIYRTRLELNLDRKKGLRIFVSPNINPIAHVQST